MNLSKLLAAGKSIMGVKEGNSPYRMNARNLLPKFVSTKNPFATPRRAPAPAQPRVPAAELETVSLFDHAAGKNPAGPVTPVTPAAETPPAAPQKIAAPKVEAPKVEPRTPAPVPARTEPATARRRTPAPELVISEKPGALRKWARAVNPLTYLGSRSANPAAGRPRPARTPFQVELSLENVRVIRNELNDPDLGMAPAKPVIIRDPTIKESPVRDTILRGTVIRGTTVPGAAVFSPAETGGFAAGVMDLGEAH